MTRLAVFAMGAMAAGEALACCAARAPGCWPPPDLADPDSAIFIGTVSEILPWLEIAGGTRVALRVREIFTQQAQPMFEVRQSGEHTDVGFRVGESYFVRAHKVRRSGYWATSICSGTALTSASGDEIGLLRRLKAGEPNPATVEGILVDSTPRLTRFQPRVNWAGAVVRLDGGGHVLETRANNWGAFSFGAVDRAKYTLSAKAAGFRQIDVVPEYSRVQEPMDLSRGGCAKYQVRMVSPQGAIRGRVRPAAGEMLPNGLYLEIEAANAQQRSGSRTTPVRADGSFLFEQLSAGAYIVSIGRSVPLHKDPAGTVQSALAYPPVYYPGFGAESSAEPVRIRSTETVNIGTWALPKRRRERSITVQAVRPDGSPTVGVRLQAQPSGPIRSFGFSVGPTDSAGVLRFVAHEGVRYRVYGLGATANEHFDSDPVAADFRTSAVTVKIRTRPMKPFRRNPQP